MLRASTWTLACAAAFVFALSACGGGGGGETTPPAPTPPGSMNVSSSSLNLESTGANTTFTTNESGYTGAFTVSLDPASCTTSSGAVATVSPMSANGPSATFTVTAGSAGGTCRITVSDSFGQQKSVSAVVTITQGVIQ